MALLFTLGMTACAPEGVVNEKVQPVAATDRDPSEDGAAGVIARANARSVAQAPTAVRACITRNNGVQQDADRAWHKQGRQHSHVTIINAVYRRLGVKAGYGGRRNDLVLHGFLGYGFDVGDHRLIMQVDPRLIEVTEFRRWVNGVAERASVGRYRRSRLRVTVQRR
jgi:hypothetical protein